MPYPYFHWVHWAVHYLFEYFPVFVRRTAMYCMPLGSHESQEHGPLHIQSVVTIAGFCLMLGIGSRPSAAICAIIYWVDFFLSGATNFVNHYYFKAFVARSRPCELA